MLIFNGRAVGTTPVDVIKINKKVNGIKELIMLKWMLQYQLSESKNDYQVAHSLQNDIRRMRKCRKFL